MGTNLKEKVPLDVRLLMAERQPHKCYLMIGDEEAIIATAEKERGKIDQWIFLVPNDDFIRLKEKLGKGYFEQKFDPYGLDTEINYDWLPCSDIRMLFKTATHFIKEAKEEAGKYQPAILIRKKESGSYFTTVDVKGIVDYEMSKLAFEIKRIYLPIGCESNRRNVRFLDLNLFLFFSQLSYPKETFIWMEPLSLAKPVIFSNKSNYGELLGESIFALLWPNHIL